MKRVSAMGLAATLLLGGCGLFGEDPEPVMSTGVEVEPECPTLWVFSDTEIKPPNGEVPEEWRAFSGVWGKAGWDGHWCHDLYVMEIGEDGTVIVMDVHGPGGKHDGTVFPRTGRIDDDNRLSFIADGVRREYWVEDGKLRGVRHLSADRKMSIAMHPK